ncbi:MAG: sigma-70 family RNA polymerase sigma factor [Planctomycetes bacterium]|nr:sigma-70 family RNA polymerase sigma factor [Planctomycetota bacterium]
MGDALERLAHSASRGDPQAVDELLAELVPDLRRYLAHHAGAMVGAKESSSDLAQSVCREVLERLRSERLEYRGAAEFRQWVFNAALYKLQARRRFYLAAMRDAGREQGLDAPGGESSGADGGARDAGQASPSEAAVLREEVERLRAALSKLPENYRQVIHLAHVDGLSHKEIAERLGISEANSRVLLSRALARLATLGVSA